MHRFRVIVTARLCPLLIIIGCSLMIVSCAPKPLTPVIERSPAQQTADLHRVERGDTLYSIAWQSSLDYQQLAHWNNIVSPFVIKIGQRLRLSPPVGYVASNTNRPARVQPAQDKIKMDVATVASTKANSAPARQTAPKRLMPIADHWLWPVKGQVINKFSRNKGINGIQIAAKSGTPVQATQAGEVVYAGEGLRGYGRLVIIKHSKVYLSAYAHNSAILVEEGQTIRQGANIARVGKTGADRNKLHFEIRKNGKPVNPLQYLKK